MTALVPGCAFILQRHKEDDWTRTYEPNANRAAIARTTKKDNNIVITSKAATC